MARPAGHAAARPAVEPAPPPGGAGRAAAAPRRPKAWAPGYREVAERDRASGAGPPMGTADGAADRGAARPPSGWLGPVGYPRWGGLGTANARGIRRRHRCGG